MKLTREKALELHRQMWSDMQKELGDCPTHEERARFKESWCIVHTPEAIPYANCFLCEYTAYEGKKCSNSCPIDWGGRNCMNDKIDFRYSPISEILALPERKTDGIVKSYTKADYIMALHKEYGVSLEMAAKAHDKALEYLRSEAKMKG